jgi:hypothetical protein
MKVFVKYSQFRKWSVPNKIGYIASFVTILSFVIGVMSFLFSVLFNQGVKNDNPLKPNSIPDSSNIIINIPHVNQLKQQYKKYYRITLVLPSHLNKSIIYVDKKPAQVVEDYLTFKVIKIEAKEGMTLITIKNRILFNGFQKDTTICEKQLFIKGNITITPCE